MPSVTVTAAIYPFNGVVGFNVQEITPWGNVEVLDTPTVGTFPNYISSYAVTVTDATNPLQVRWETSAGFYTAWFSPSTVAVPATSATSDRIKQAVIQKATRILMLSKAPLGMWGELNEFGVATVRADYEIQELLFGLRFINWDVDPLTLADTDDVIRIGLQADPATFPTDRVADVQMAIDGAASWVAAYLLDGANVA